MYTFLGGFPSLEWRKVGNILDLILTKYGYEILLFEGLGVILTFFKMTLEFDRSVLEKLHEASYVRSRSYLGMYFIPSKLMIYMHHSKHEIISGFFLHTCIHHSIFIRTVRSKLLLCSIVVHSFPSWLDWTGLGQKSVYCACCSAQTAHKQVWTGSVKYTVRKIVLKL